MHLHYVLSNMEGPTQGMHCRSWLAYWVSLISRLHQVIAIVKKWRGKKSYILISILNQTLQDSQLQFVLWLSHYDSYWNIWASIMMQFFLSVVPLTCRWEQKTLWTNLMTNLHLYLMTMMYIYQALLPSRLQDADEGRTFRLYNHYGLPAHFYTLVKLWFYHLYVMLTYHFHSWNGQYCPLLYPS